MEELKKEVLKLLVPKAVLLPLSQKAKHSITNEKIIPISHIPYKIGRESRMEEPKKGLFVKLRKLKNTSEPNNDVYLVDKIKPMQISKEHCEISKENDEYILIDKGSRKGTTLNGITLGGKNTVTKEILKDGDIIQIGSENSEFKFQFLVFNL